jgi:hypothetical protein
MASVSLRGKDKVLKHFTNVNEAWWKLYNASDMKTPIQVQLNPNVKNTASSKVYLTEILDSVDPNGTYVLDTFGLEQKNEGFRRSSTSMCFTLSETAPIQEPDEKGKNNSGFSGSIGIRDHISMIHENSKLAAECEMWKTKYTDLQASFVEMKKENEELLDEIDELEEEIEQLEEGEEEENEKGIMGAITKLVEENGGAIIETLMGEKGVKGMPKDPEEEVVEEVVEEPTSGTEKKEGEEGEEEEEGEENVTMNGIDSTTMPDVNTIVEELKKHDSKLQRHLFKLLLIARQKPMTFKTLLIKIEKY